MPVALETQALRGGPPQASILSHQGIAHLRAMASKTREAQLYTHATLLKEQWVEIDNLWLRVADQYMGAVMDLTSRGLTQTIPSLGIAASQYQAINRMDNATTDMRASAAGNNQRLTVTPASRAAALCVRGLRVRHYRTGSGAASAAARWRRRTPRKRSARSQRRLKTGW